jgi:M6 family metalloprotease-like protein
MKKFLALLLTVSLLAITPVAYSATPRIGQACSKSGQRVFVAKVPLVCKVATQAQQKKAKSRLVWAKFVAPKPAPVLAPKSPLSPVDPQPVPVLGPKSPLSPSASFASVDGCRVQDNSEFFNKSGFPQHSQMKRSGSKLVVQLIYIDFADVVASGKPSDDKAFWTDGVSKFLGDMSNGVVDFEWRTTEGYSRMSRKLADYRVTRTAGGNTIPLVQEAITLADSQIDFTGVDFVVAVLPPNTPRELSDVSPALTLSQNSPFRTDEGKVYRATLVGGDMRFPEGHLLLTHEIGHLLGLNDYYWYGWKQGMVYEDQFKFMGNFDNMNFAPGDSREWTAWSRWIIDFLPDSKVLCAKEGTEASAQLDAVSKVGTGPQLLVIRTSPTEAIAVESRRNTRHDSKASSVSNGLLVYKIDTTIMNGQGPLRIVRKPNSVDALFSDAPLKPGESLQVGSWIISNLESGTDWDVAKITPAK